MTYQLITPGEEDLSPLEDEEISSRRKTTIATICAICSFIVMTCIVIGFVAGGIGLYFYNSQLLGDIILTILGIISAGIIAFFTCMVLCAVSAVIFICIAEGPREALEAIPSPDDK